MSEPLRLVVAFVAGLALGVVHFGGLWLTVRRLPGSRHPALLAFASFLVRTAAVVLGIYVAALVPRPGPGQWRRVALRVALCLGGVLIVRTLIVRRLAPRAPGARGVRS